MFSRQYQLIATLQSNNNIDMTYSQGKTHLHYFFDLRIKDCKDGTYVETVKLLVSEKNIDMIDKTRFIPLYYLAREIRLYNGQIRTNDVSAVVELLLSEHNALNIEDHEGQNTIPLVLSKIHYDDIMLQGIFLAFASKINLDVQDKSGKTLLHYAVEQSWENQLVLKGVISNLMSENNVDLCD